MNKKLLTAYAMLILLCGCQSSTETESVQTAAEHTVQVASQDHEAPVIGCEVDVRIQEGDSFLISDYCTYSDNRTWYPKMTMYGNVDTSRAEQQKIYLTVTDEAGNMAVHEMDVIVTPKPTPAPTPEPEPEQHSGSSGWQNSYEWSSGYENSASSQESYTPSYSEAGYGSGDYYTPPAGSHGTEYYWFSDGYDIDSAYSACIAAMGYYGNSTCTPMMNEEGLYTGYRLDY